MASFYITQWLKLTILVNFFSNILTYSDVIVATSPVNPVKEQGLLTIHCQVRNLDDNHQVTITRRVGDRIQQISVDEDVLGNAVDERVFLAVRQLLDGSTVYFLFRNARH